LVFGPPSPPASAAELAIGSSERDCRKRGDCLETGNLDGALGFNWGGRDRCAASDPTCTTGGAKVESLNAVDFSPPSAPGGEAVSWIVSLTVEVARETAEVRIGLFGDSSRADQLLSVFSGKGFVTGPRLELEPGLGVTSSPLRVVDGAATLTALDTQTQRMQFGIKSQAVSFARRQGLRKAPDDFVPQPRPRPLPQEAAGPAALSSRPAPGLLLMDRRGLGWLDEAVDDDEAFSSLFELTGWGRDKAREDAGRVAVGKCMDEESMRVLHRLATLPVNKKFAGIVGATKGPPLVGVKILSARLEEIAAAVVREPS